MHRRHALSCFLVTIVLLASCSGAEGGFLSRSPEESAKAEAVGPFCGPLERLNNAKLDLIRRATSGLEIESTADKIRALQEEISAEAPPEVRDQVRLTTTTYSGYLEVLESDGYADAPIDQITSDPFNKAELSLVSYCFQNPTR